MSKEDQVIMGFRDLINKMESLNKLKMKDSLKGYQSSEVHCIDYIGKHADSNVTKLAESFFVTRGAVSKMAQKLLKKGIITTHQKPDNKKEVYFSLTEKGQAIYKIHEELHKEFQERDGAVFEQVTEEQYDGMLRFIQRYSAHLDGEIKKQGVDIGSRDSFE